MILNDVLELTKAGWTKEEIISLFGSNTPKEEAPKEDASKDEAPEEEAPKEEAPKESSQPALSDTKIDELIAHLEKLSSGIQKGNLQSSRQPKQVSVEESLASIINPYLFKEE